MKSVDTLRKEMNRQVVKITKNTMVWIMSEYVMECDKYVAMVEEMKEIDNDYYRQSLINITKMNKNKKFVRKS